MSGDDWVQYRLALTDTSNQPLPTDASGNPQVAVGQTFRLHGYNQDIRQDADSPSQEKGVFAAYMDVFYTNANLITIRYGETQQLRFSRTDPLSLISGSFNLTFDGQTTPQSITYDGGVDYLAEKIQLALEALPNVGSGNVRVTVEPPNTSEPTNLDAIRVQFLNALGERDLPLIVVDSENLSNCQSAVAIELYPADPEHAGTFRSSFTGVDPFVNGLKAWDKRDLEAGQTAGGRSFGSVGTFMGLFNSPNPSGPFEFFYVDLKAVAAGQVAFSGNPSNSDVDPYKETDTLVFPSNSALPKFIAYPTNQSFLQDISNQLVLEIYPVQIPSVPNPFTVTATSPDTVSLTWGDSTDETRYEVYRWSSTDGTVLVGTVDADVTSYEVSGLQPGTRQFFDLRACNRLGCQRTDWQLVVMPPTRPDPFIARAASPTTVDLTWGDANGETRYDVYRWSEATGSTLVTALPANATSYTVSGLLPGTRQFFDIRAAFDVVSSRTDWQLVVMPVPSAPQSFTVTVTSPNTVDLTWGDTTGETRYDVYRWSEMTGIVLVTTLPAGVTSYTVSGLVPGTRQFFDIRAVYGEVSSRTDWQLATMPPTQPDAFNARATSPTTVDLTWGDATGETRYDVYRWTEATGTILAATLPANVTSYTVGSLVPGTRQFFAIYAAYGEASSHTDWQLVVMPILDYPRPFTATVTSPTTIDLTWGDTTGEMRYDIYRWSEATGATFVTSLQADVTGYTVSGLAPGTRQFFDIRAIYSESSSRTDWLLAVMPPTTPDPFTAIATSPTSVELTWGNATGETRYDIYRWSEATGTVLVTTLPANVTSFTVGGLAPGSRQFFDVHAVYDSASSRTGWQLIVMPTASGMTMAADMPLQAGRGSLAMDEVLSLVDGAESYWIRAGVPDENLAKLNIMKIEIGDLPGDLLGISWSGGIILDDDATGYGWFIDPTPDSHTEFQLQDDETYRATELSPARYRADLLTVLIHEMGHHLGYDHQDSTGDASDVMAADLSLGERRLPWPTSVDEFFADNDAVH